MGETHIELKGVRHEYDGAAAVSIDDLIVERGKTLVLIGPNGSGKSTLLRLIGLLEKPMSGRIKVDDVDPWAEGRALEMRRRMAAVFQEPLLFSGTVYANVAYGLKLRGLKKDDVDRRVRKVLDLVGIAHLKNRNSHKLSGGEAQRTSLARALALEPEILLLDEPLASLDPPTREGLLDDFERILKDAGVTTVYVTHNRGEALRLADEIAVMVDGSVDQVGIAGEVFEHPRTPTVADIVGCDNRIEGIVSSSDGGIATIAIGDMEVEAITDCEIGERVLVCLRPEDITILNNGGPRRSSARNRFEGKVIKLVDMGPLMRITVSASVDLVALLTKKSAEEMKLDRGATVTASFKATGVHVIPLARN